METHLIIIDSKCSEFVLLDLIDKYLAGLSKDKIRYQKNNRRIIVDSLNMEFYFRKTGYQLLDFLKGREFKTVRMIECFPENKILHELYMRSEEIKIEKEKR